MGEEIGVFEGSYKITAGLLKEFGAEARDRHADRGGGLPWRGDRRGHARPAAGGRDHDRQLQPAGHGPDREPRGEDPLHVRRPGARADGHSHARGRRPAARGDPLAELLGLVRLHPGLEGRRAGHAQRRPRPAQGRRSATTIRSCSWRTWRCTTRAARSPASATRARTAATTAGADDDVVPIGTAAIMKEGHDLTLIGYSRMSVVALEVARRLEQDEGISCEVIDVRSLRPLDRPTLIESVSQTEPGGDRRGGLVLVRRRRRARRDDPGGRLRLPGCAHQARRAGRGAACPTPRSWSRRRCPRRRTWSTRSRARSPPAAIAPAATAEPASDDRRHHAAPQRHDGGGDDRHLAQEARRPGRARRRARRGRDRQGDHGPDRLRGWHAAGDPGRSRHHRPHRPARRADRHRRPTRSIPARLPASGPRRRTARRRATTARSCGCGR